MTLFIAIHEAMHGFARIIVSFGLIASLSPINFRLREQRV